MLFLFLLSSYLLNVLGSEKGPEIKTAFGTYNGFRYNEADVFLGIKYASPARGEMRFEKPTFIERAKITINATAFGPRCFPTFKSDVNLEEATYSEDCLFLNIMMPSKKLEDETGFPILFVIIGGAYNSPNVDSYGFEHWCDNFVSRGMIVVTIQYRHGFLGFFTTGDHYIYGNMALWDLTFGLFYVDNVIPIFNGNRKDVTVMGIDAGAAYASALALSPHSSFLFKKIIQIGGGIYSGNFIHS
uniref:COesterase domain-containing protein n=1 Tax=Rhabditophanes sp. KR3021 TaxID=114890 RepID=A0AC35TMW4_9BILA